MLSVNLEKTMAIPTQPHSLSRIVFCEFDETLSRLRSALQTEKLDIICELPFHREFQRSMGVTCRRYTVLVVWGQFETWRAVLTEDDAGLLMPFNIAIFEDSDFTRIAVHNMLGKRQLRATIGVSLMLHDVEVKMRRVIAKCTPQTVPRQ